MTARVFALFCLLLMVLAQIHAATSTISVPERPPTFIPPAHEGGNPVTMIALAAMIISLVSCFWMMIGQRKSASTDYVLQLEKRIEALDRELQVAELRLAALETENGRLMRENIELLRQLARLPPSSL